MGQRGSILGDGSRRTFVSPLKSLPSAQLEREVFPRQCIYSSSGRLPNTVFERSDEPNRTGNMVEDQEALLMVQDRVVVRKALVIAHVIEGFEHRNTRLQNPHRHLRLKMPLSPELLYVFSEKAMQRLLARNHDSMLFAERPHKLNDEGVQPVETRFRFILLESLAGLPRDNLEVPLVDVGGQRVDFVNEIGRASCRERV